DATEHGLLLDDHEIARPIEVAHVARREPVRAQSLDRVKQCHRLNLLELCRRDAVAIAARGAATGACARGQQCQDGESKEPPRSDSVCHDRASLADRSVDRMLWRVDTIRECEAGRQMPPRSVRTRCTDYGWCVASSVQPAPGAPQQSRTTVRSSVPVSKSKDPSTSAVTPSPSA